MTARSRFIRRLGVDGRAAVTLQWVCRAVAGTVALGIIGFVAPMLGGTVLSPSQFLDRFLALNHTFPTPGAVDPAIYGASPLQSVDLGVTLLVWWLQLFVIGCWIFVMWSLIDHGVARDRPRSVATDQDGES